MSVLRPTVTPPPPVTMHRSPIWWRWRAGIGATLLLCGIAGAGRPLQAQGTASPAQREAQTRGDAAFRADRYDEALTAYREALRGDTIGVTRALYRVGVLLSWRGTFAPAIAAHEAYVRYEPSDLEGRVALGRVLAWDGQYRQAIAQYDSVLAREPEHREAVRGRATTSAWSGDYARAEADYGRWLTNHPEDVELWVGLAQVRRWQGRLGAARQALDQALAVRPDYPEAVEQARWVDSESMREVMPSIEWSGDSDGNRSLSFALGTTAPIGGEGHRLGATAIVRSASTGPLETIATGVRGRGVLSLGGGQSSFRIDGGVTSLETTGGPARLVGVGSVRLVSQTVPRLRVGFGGGRSAFDEVATTITRGLMLDVVDADVAYQGSARLAVNAGAGLGRVTGRGLPNGRLTANAETRLLLGRGRWVGLSGRTVAFDSVRRDGYFSPRRYVLGEATAHWERPRDLGWQAAFDAGIGQQGLRLDEASALRWQLAWRGTMAVGYRPRPGREIGLRGSLATILAPGAVSVTAYRWGTLSLVGRWTL